MCDDKKPEANAPAATAESSGAAPKKRHRVLKIVGIVLAVLVIGVLGALLALDVIVVGAVRTVAPQLTGTRVELDSVRTRLLQGRLELHGFKVGNPEGFLAPDAFVLNTFVAQVDPATVLGDRIIVPEVTIDGMTVDFEPSLSGGSNLHMIKANLERAAGLDRAAEKTESGGPEAPADGKSAKKVIIRRLAVRNMRLAVGKAELPLPDITLNDLGDGKSLSEVLDEFLTALLNNVVVETGRQGLSALGDGLNDGAKSLGDGLGDGAKAIDRGVKDAIGSLNSLLGGDRDGKK